MQVFHFITNISVSSLVCFTGFSAVRELIVGVLKNKMLLTSIRKDKQRNKCLQIGRILLFSYSVISYSSWSHGLQQARLPCSSPSPEACSKLCPLSQWNHPTISSSVISFSSCLQSFPVSGSFPVSQLFASGSQSIGISASASVLPMNIQDWFPLGLTGLISLQYRGLSRHHRSKASIFWHSTFFILQISHPYITTGKNMPLTRWIFAGKVMCLLFNMFSRLAIAFLPRSKHLLISWLQSPSAVFLESKKIKSVTLSIVFPIYLPWSDGTRCHDLSFLNVEF